MKKIATLFLLLNFLCTNFAQAIIEDDFAKNTLDKNLKSKSYKSVRIDDTLIGDDFIRAHKNEKYGAKDIIFRDDFASQTLRGEYDFVKYFPIDFTNMQNVTFEVKPKKHISTRNKNLKEGSFIEFAMCEDVDIQGVKYKKGAKITARIENVSLNDIAGVPASLELSNFKIEDRKIHSKIEIAGANRTIWVYPLIYIGSMFYGAGFVFVPIRGGHAKLKPSRAYKVHATVF